MACMYTGEVVELRGRVEEGQQRALEEQGRAQSLEQDTFNLRGRYTNVWLIRYYVRGS